MAALLVNVACGSCFVEGWLNLDYAPASSLVIKTDLLKPLSVDDNAADVVYSSHFFEHVPRERTTGFLMELLRVLKPGGRIRLVLPDLEELCREYLRQREQGEHEKADFVTLEMLDQCVRRRAGGELEAFYARLAGSRAQEMSVYVKSRTGEDLSGVRVTQQAMGGVARMKNALRRPAGIRNALERWYCRAVTKLLPAAFVEQNISFASVGERHAWIYDFHVMSQMLEQTGFKAIRRMRFDQSEIPGFPLCPLDVTPEGVPRKGAGSMYIEATKPEARRQDSSRPNQGKRQ